MKKKDSEGVKEVRAFTTTDGKIHKNKKLANDHQDSLNFWKKQAVITKAIRTYLDIPDVSRLKGGGDWDKSKEGLFLTEYYNVTGTEYEDLEGMVYDLMHMVLMDTMTRNWSEIFSLIEKYTKELEKHG